VVLVHPGEHILPELQHGGGAAGYGDGHPRLVAAAERHLRKLGVELCLGARLAAVSGEEVVLKSGVRIPTRTAICAVGTAMPPVLAGLDLPRDEHGRIRTDAYLRVEGHEALWAAGDCAANPHPKGGTCPMTGLYALAAGKQLARNLVATLRGRPLRPLSYPGIGQACAIGRRYAVGEVKGVEVTGLPAWLMWRALLWAFIPTADRRLRVLADWLIWPFVGRDIVEFRVGDGQGIEHVHAEAGEFIVRRGDLARKVYVVRSGEVEVLGTPGEGDVETVLRVLGPGSHFGSGDPTRNRRISNTARARGPVELLAIGYHHAQELAALTHHEALLTDEALG
ncbi:MAG TPA: cyclic nucleotide-binding domain-containing protein, partial [Limnochordia bacterium]|nr:cyclic nucleotide-binding domain-containing protein [Limnochordia bacterium]